MDNGSISLPHDVVGGHDSLRLGLPNLKQDALPLHPVETVQRTHRKLQVETQTHMLQNLYGSAFPTKLRMEEHILSRVQRPPGLLNSSRLGLESYTGALDSFEIEDYLSDPRESESFRLVDMHHGMEVRLGLSKGPVGRAFP